MLPSDPKSLQAVRIAPLLLLYYKSTLTENREGKDINISFDFNKGLILRKKYTLYCGKHHIKTTTVYQR